jgi:DNA-binding NtrC family response regulator
MSAPSKHSVLLVDDEPDVLYSLKGLLRREFELHTAESGAEALEILKQHPIHVIMTDQRMPGMTGVELMQQTRSAFPDAIRIVFTGYADIKAVIQAINKGGLYRYITKPWDPEELIETLHDAASQYQAQVDQRRLTSELRDCVAEMTEYVKSLPQAPVRLAELAEKLAQLEKQFKGDSAS